MPTRPLPRLVRLYRAHREPIEAAVGTAVWVALISVLYALAPDFC